MPRSDSSSTPARARLALVATLALAAVASPASPSAQAAAAPPPQRPNGAVHPAFAKLLAQSARPGRSAGSARTEGRKPQADQWIVELTAPPLARYRGSIAGLDATAPAATGRPVDRRSADARAYAGELSRRQAAVIASAAPSVRPSVEYRTAFNGFAAKLSDEQVRALRDADGVRSVVRERFLTLETAPAAPAAQPASRPGRAGSSRPGRAGSGRPGRCDRARQGRWDRRLGGRAARPARRTVEAARRRRRCRPRHRRRRRRLGRHAGERLVRRRSDARTAGDVARHLPDRRELRRRGVHRQARRRALVRRRHRRRLPARGVLPVAARRGRPRHARRLDGGRQLGRRSADRLRPAGRRPHHRHRARRPPRRLQGVLGDRLLLGRSTSSRRSTPPSPTASTS